MELITVACAGHLGIWSPSLCFPRDAAGRLGLGISSQAKLWIAQSPRKGSVSGQENGEVLRDGQS